LVSPGNDAVVTNIYLSVIGIYVTPLVQKNAPQPQGLWRQLREGTGMGAALGSLAEVRELKREIAGLRTDLKRYIERANQQQVEIVLRDLNTRHAGTFARHQVEDARADLCARMPGDCPMQERCYGVFMDFLQTTSQHIRDGNISDEIVRAYREQMESMRQNGPFDRCGTCFSEVHRLFEKQIDLMTSLGIYQAVGEKAEEAAVVPDEAAVREILEPVANSQRFQILTSLMTQTRTFSDLAQLTGLRGGNLTFHIRKLTESGMLLQRHDRGDYIITDKGFKTMTAIGRLHRLLGPV
jgi:DNA-binding transcriptional ArsR family regulator